LRNSVSHEPPILAKVHNRGLLIAKKLEREEDVTRSSKASTQKFPCFHKQDIDRWNFSLPCGTVSDTMLPFPAASISCDRAPVASPNP
jgi:hypothetical protein